MAGWYDIQNVYYTFFQTFTLIAINEQLLWCLSLSVTLSHAELVFSREIKQIGSVAFGRYPCCVHSCLVAVSDKAQSGDEAGVIISKSVTVFPSRQEGNRRISDWNRASQKPEPSPKLSILGGSKLWATVETTVVVRCGEGAVLVSKHDWCSYSIAWGSVFALSSISAALIWGKHWWWG